MTPQVTIARNVLTDRKSQGRKHTLRQLAQVVAELRQEAKEKGLNSIPKREINVAWPLPGEI